MEPAGADNQLGTAPPRTAPSDTPAAQGMAKAVLEPPRPGTTPLISLSEGQPTSITACVQEGQTWHEIEVAEADWSAVDRLSLRFGPSPDLVISLRLRESLGRSELVQVDLVSAEDLVLARDVWPATWEELVSSVRGGTFFRVGRCLRGGMDPDRQAELAAIQFTSDLDWPLLDQGYELLRRQESLPSEFPPVHRRMAELLAEATQLYQWEHMLALPVGVRGMCSPARMAALKVLLDRKQGNLIANRPPPPWVTTGVEGQIIELRFNSVPPPQGLPPGNVSREAIKDWLLSRLERALPDLGTRLSDGAGSGIDYRWVRDKIRIDGDCGNLQEYSLTVLLPYGPWVNSLVSRQVSIEGSYCTVAPFGTHIEVPLSPTDHATFRSIRISLGLGPATSLDLLEDGLSRAFRGNFVSCRFTTVNSTAGGKGKKRVFTHFSTEDDRASTLLTVGAESLIMARRKQLYTAVHLGADSQYPITLMIQLPAPPQWVLHTMVGSERSPPLRLRASGSLFISDRVLLGPLPEGWLTSKVDFFSEIEQEKIRREMSSVFRTHLQTENLQLVGRREHKRGRREKVDQSPLFIYLEFPGVGEAQTFGAKSDDGSLPGEFHAFWNAYIGGTIHMWSSMVLLEALEVVSPDKWASLMERGSQSPCPPSDPNA